MKNRIRAMREDMDLTQQQVASSLGITQRKYSYLETGVQQWTDEFLVKLADYYHVSIDYLLYQTDNPRRND
ncbi:MAG: helix-turn-helix transcriptional regulator [Bacillota bacterium]|nr:helix-turn-helix transcriptional regulator [Bacillota bacterium]